MNRIHLALWSVLVAAGAAAPAFGHADPAGRAHSHTELAVVDLSTSSWSVLAVLLGVALLRGRGRRVRAAS